MKIRQGFVSNSSSSSFILAIKQGRELDEANIRPLLGAAYGTPMYGIAEKIAKHIARRAKKTSIREFLNDSGYDSLEDAVENGWHMTKQMAEALMSAEGMDVYTFYASDEDGDGIESMLCNEEFNIKTPDLVLVGGGGY
jgi:hypothetical protein